jgi:hypothetical protein
MKHHRFVKVDPGSMLLRIWNSGTPEFPDFQISITASSGSLSESVSGSIPRPDSDPDTDEAPSLREGRPQVDVVAHLELRNTGIS